MSLTLSVDGERWRGHLRGFAEATPGLVPVAKGNGYGFTLGRLARKAQWLARQGLGVDTLDPDDSHVGLIQFKVGTGGEAVEYAGEWDLPLNRALYKAFDLYMRRR